MIGGSSASASSNQLVAKFGRTERGCGPTTRSAAEAQLLRQKGSLDLDLHGPALVGIGNSRMRRRSLVRPTIAPFSKSSAICGKLAAISSACSAERRWSAERKSRTDGDASEPKASRVSCGQQPDVRDMDRVVPCLFEMASDLGREVRVEEQLHAAGATTASSRSCAAAAAYSSAARTSSRSR